MASPDIDPGTVPVEAQRQLIDRYCMGCHNYSDYAGGVEFEIFDPGNAHDSAAITERILKELRAGMMPPAGKPHPDFATVQALATSLEAEIDSHAKPDLREPQLHRLNRAEYANAVRDLLALDIDAAQFLPSDDASRGFDNQAGGLILSPALLEAYLAAAARVSRVAMGAATATTRSDGPAPASVVIESASRAQILTCHPSQASEEEPCARDIAKTLAWRAYRGYATPKDVDTLMSFYASGRRDGSFDAGIGLLVQRLLSDPKFVYRVEATPADLAPGTSYRISDLDLASRLSFFLWSSIPDDTLLRLAQAGKLSQPPVLRQQVRRMLADPRAAAMTNSFAGQWLGLRSLATPAAGQFPDFDDTLRQAFLREVQLLFSSLLEEDRSVLDLLTADYTFLDERLARFYGIQGVRGSYFRRVELDESQSPRRGLLGKGAILTVSSLPGRTSPVIRGNWVLRNIIGVPAPDPPANVPALPSKSGDAAGHAKLPSIREQMVQHRSDPGCQGCHQLMDPIGFALEPFDATGRWRTQDNGDPIDSHSETYDGTRVDGPDGVRTFLLKHQDQYLRNVTRNLLTYALGRGIEYDDMPAVRSVMRMAAGDGYKLRSLITAVALSDNFLMNVVPRE